MESEGERTLSASTRSAASRRVSWEMESTIVVSLGESVDVDAAELDWNERTPLCATELHHDVSWLSGEAQGARTHRDSGRAVRSNCAKELARNYAGNHVSHCTLHWTYSNAPPSPKELNEWKQTAHLGFRLDDQHDSQTPQFSLSLSLTSSMLSPTMITTVQAPISTNSTVSISPCSDTTSPNTPSTSPPSSRAHLAGSNDPPLRS